MRGDGTSQTRLTNSFDNDFLIEWSQDGTKILSEGFDGVSSDIFMLDLRDGTRTNLTNTSFHEASSRLSPDGKKIVYQSYGDAKEAEIYVMDSDGGNSTNLTEAPAFGEVHPVWSPDGNFVYFTSERSGSVNFWRIRVNADTGDAVGKPEPVGSPSTYSRHLNFSRDGTKMIYVQTNNRANIRAVD